MSNPYRTAAQLKKASKLTARLRQFDITAAEAATMTAEQWGMLAQAASVNPPSAETVAMVIQSLREPSAAEMDALFAWAGAA